jgi:hypothetical protein
MPHQTKGQDLNNSKVSPRFRLLAVMVGGLMLARVPAGAQTLGNDSPTNAIDVNDQLTYALSLTNFTGFTVEVSNVLSGPVQVRSFTSPVPATISNSTLVVFTFNPLAVGTITSWTVTVRPTGAGSITNTIHLYVPSALTNVFTTNLVNQVTNAIVVTTNTADLAVSITVPTQAVLVNDSMTFSITVTNWGPDTASNVFLTNDASALVFLTSPTNLTYGTTATTNILVVWDLGTFPSLTYETFELTGRVTNEGPLRLSAWVGSTNADLVDPNLTNNYATNTVFITNALPGQLVADFASPIQTFNPQNGLMEQVLLLSNVGTSSVASARVVLSGLTSTNWLFNAAGTNSGNPYVVYAAPLNPNQSVGLLLQYFVPTGLPFAITSNQLQALAVPAYDLTPPSNPGTNIAISAKYQLPSGSILIEFPSITNRGYTMLYSDNATFTNAKVALPSITAPADRVQWIDYGPPGTLSLPAGTNSRFYRVYLNP